MNIPVTANKLAEFINNPKILGISLNDNDRENSNAPADPPKPAAAEKKDN